MSLLRLLVTGRSLVNVRDLGSRYRLTNQRLLPQFGPTENPFVSAGDGGPPATGAVRTTGEAGRGSSKPGTGSPGRGLRLGATALLRAWKERRGALAPRPFGKMENPSPARHAKTPVQGELSLDRVKVVRNDLSDADLEATTATARHRPAPIVLASEAASRVGRAWGRVTARLLPAGKA